MFIDRDLFENGENLRARKAFTKCMMSHSKTDSNANGGADKQTAGTGCQ